MQNNSLHFQKQRNYSSADSRLIWQGAAPCGPFQRLTCARQPFSMLYIRQADLSDPLYMCPAAHSVCVSTFVCVYLSVCKSPKRLLNAGTQKVAKCTKNREKINRRSRDHFWRIRCIITGGINYKRNCMSLKMNENCFVSLFSLQKCLSKYTGKEETISRIF